VATLTVGAPRKRGFPPVLLLFVLVPLLVEGFWVFWPAIQGLYLSFTKWDGISPPQSVGLGNYRAMLDDPVFSKAIELQGLEENRHARLLVALTSHYRIAVVTPPPFEPRSLENDFLFAGFGECFDSFFAFGLFALAHDSGYFAPPLVAIFEPVIQEEARHILFFINLDHPQTGRGAHQNGAHDGQGAGRKRREFHLERASAVGRPGYAAQAVAAVPERERAPHGRL